MHPTFTILKGDNRHTLKTQPENSVHTCAGSPPYYSVRDYGTEPIKFPRMTFQPAIGLPQFVVPAWTGQLGLEPDPWWYIGHLLLTYRAVKRELRDVWTVATNGAEKVGKGEEQHYATYPKALVLPMVRAGTSERGCCPECGAPWERIIGERAAALSCAAHGILFGGEEPAATYMEKITTGWRPTCVCGAPEHLELQPSDLETFETPTGEQLGADNTLSKGRAAAKQFERVDTGKRLITKYEHRKYAEQLKTSPRRHDMQQEAAERGGKDAFEHYERTDAHGARPIPPDLLESWLEKLWLREVRLPSWTFPKPVPCTVLDPFGGTGTTGEVANEEGRHALICELAPHYLPLIEERKSRITPPLPVMREHERPFAQV